MTGQPAQPAARSDTGPPTGEPSTGAPRPGQPPPRHQHHREPRGPHPGAVRQLTMQPVPIPASPARRPAETSHQSGRRRATVAHLLAEECRTSVAGGHDATNESVRNLNTSLKARGARRAPMARPLRARAQPARNLMTWESPAGQARCIRRKPPSWCGHSALAPSAHGGRPPGGSPGQPPAPARKLQPPHLPVRVCARKSRYSRPTDPEALTRSPRWKRLAEGRNAGGSSHPRSRSLSEPPGTRQGRLTATLRAALD